MPNGFLTTENILDTDTQLLGYPETVYYSGASGVNVDNTNLIISLTGEVGKVYSGINPIVVNNEENYISANSAPIGVQEPLYFVQDDDEAVVIGLSGEYVTPSDIAGKMDTSSFESWQQGQYTNDLTAINEKINEVSSNIPSIEGLATEQLVEETSAAIVSQIPSTAGLASETYVQEQTSAKASKSDLETVSGDIVNLIPDVSNYYTKNETSGAEQLAEAFANIPGGEGDEEVNALVHSNSATWNEVSSKLDESTFQEASGLFLTAIPQEYITESDIPSFISAKLDTDVFADVSGSFLTAVDLTPYVPASAIGTKVYGGVNIVSSISGFKISAFEAAHTTFASIANESLTAETAYVAYRDSKNNWITAYYQPKLDFSGLDGTITAINSSAVAGDVEVNQAVHTNSATWNTVTDKLDTTSFSEVSGTFLTAHQSLDGYATETLVEETSGAITSLIPTDYYPNTNPSGFISEVPNTYLQNTDLTIVDNKVTEISGVPLSAGDEFPVSADEAIQYVQSNSGTIDDTVTSYQTNSSTYMVETNLEYNAVGEISGYGNSAIAQYGAEKQWLQHDDTIVSISNSAQYAFGCNISALQRLMGIDETVLWVNPNPQMVISNTTLTAQLSDTISSYKKLRFICKGSYDYQEAFSAAVMNQDFYTNEDNKVNSVGIYLPNRRGDVNYIDCCQIQFSGNVFTANNGIRLQTTNNTGRGPYILSAIGIGRKEV